MGLICPGKQFPFLAKTVLWCIISCSLVFCPVFKNPLSTNILIYPGIAKSRFTAEGRVKRSTCALSMSILASFGENSTWFW